MDKKARRLTNRYSGATAVVAFFTQPIPAGDELAVIPMHYWFAGRMAKVRGVRRRDLPWRSIQKIIWYGAGVRLVTNFSLGLVPVVGSFSNAITAIALTEFLGRWIDAYITNPDAPPPEVTMEGLKRLFADAVKKKKKEEEQAPSPETKDEEKKEATS
jgi:uncharacterized protein (DUF697 family)